MCLHIWKRWKIYFLPHLNWLWNLNDVFTHMLCVTFIFPFRLPALSLVRVCVWWKSTVCCVFILHKKPPVHTFSLIRMMYKFSSSHISLFVEHEKVKRVLSGDICKVCKIKFYIDFIFVMSFMKKKKFKIF